MACRPAPACAAARKQLTELHPGRSQASDGICASAQHSKQNPSSDHEPDVRGIAHAVDLTHDPLNGVDCNVLVAALVARQDPRIKYLIWDRLIWRSYKTNPKQPPAWEPQPYGGSNPHTKHMHISVWTEHENDTSPWFPPSQQEDDMTDEEHAWLARVHHELVAGDTKPATVAQMLEGIEKALAEVKTLISTKSVTR